MEQNCLGNLGREIILNLDQWFRKDIVLKKYALRILPFYVNFGILSFDRWNGMFPNRPVNVYIFLT